MHMVTPGVPIGKLSVATGLVLCGDVDAVKPGDVFSEHLALEPLRREAAGVPARLVRYDGVNHGFMAWVGAVDNAGAAMNDACIWLREAFATAR
jgi:hypothetical protein